MIEHRQSLPPLENPVVSAASCADLSSTSDDFLCREDSDLLCSEHSGSKFPTERTEAAVVEESIIGFIKGEKDFVLDGDYHSRFVSYSLDASAREDSVAWMLKVQAYYGFQPLTAYLAVNYMDRVLCSSRLPQASGWPMQLLSVACLSLAAKMEEPLIPSLLDFQVEGAKYLFEPRTIGRMEVLVLNLLGWRLRSVTPLTFIDYFAWKIDPTGDFVGFICSRATEIILSNIKETSFLVYLPSSIAASAVLCAAREIPKLSPFSPENAKSWCDGLSKDNIVGCYQLLRELAVANSPGEPSKGCSDSSSSTCVWSSRKRRKLDGCSE